MDEDDTPDRIKLPDGFVEYRFVSVPQSKEYLEGVKHGFQYVRLGTEVLRYNNGVHERHHRDTDKTEVTEQSGSVEEHLERFLKEVEEMMREE